MTRNPPNPPGQLLATESALPASGGLTELGLQLDDLAYRLLRTFPRHPEAPLPSLLFTSAREGEGKTTLALALAHRMARLSGERILLADANPYRPQLQTLCALPAEPGLCDALRGELSSLPHLDARRRDNAACVLTLGSRPDPSLLYRPSAIAQLRELARGFRCIVFDGGTVRLGGSALAHHVDGVILVIDASMTRREVVQGNLQAMNLPPGRVVGALLNKRVQHIPRLFYNGL